MRAVGELLGEVLAQDTVIRTLRRGLGSGRVHHALLFDGPRGVGKELAAFGLAQALVCEARAGGDRACGDCSACARAVIRESVGPKGVVQREKMPVHPDVVVIERGLHDPARIGRRSPETQEISIDQIRTLVLARAQFGPHEGHAKVFIVRRAEELSISAANALLKTLEEPGPRTHFVLLTEARDWLLPTIRSRAQLVRFGALPETALLRLLAARGIDGPRAEEAARLAGGSLEAALEHADPDALTDRREFATRAFAAIGAKDASQAMGLAEAEKKDKVALRAKLEHLAAALHARAREGIDGPEALACAEQHRIALEALVDLDANASPQLVVEAMLLGMRAVAPPRAA